MAGGSSAGEERVYSCELEAGDVTHFGTVERIERFKLGGVERVRIFFTTGTPHSVKATTTLHVGI